MNKIRVAAVSYLNTKPLLFGIKNHPVMDDIELIEDYPSKIASLLINDDADLGLIPVAAIKKLKNWEIITDYCIGSDGAVASVGIFSEVPIEKIEKIILDYQSQTSVQLARILLKEYWKREVEFIDAKDANFYDNINGTTAAVIIGDRALTQRNYSTYFYDLGDVWKAHTGLPFVFAAWIANKKLPGSFTSQFNDANKMGLENMDTVIAENHAAAIDLKEYYTKYISFRLDEKKKQGMNLFLSKLPS